MRSVALTAEDVLRQLEKGRLHPVYLFYGPSEFQIERTLSKIRDSFAPEGVRDFNLQIFYGDETGSEEILEAAQSFPFMAERRLIIVRRTEALSRKALEGVLPYLERPTETTCLIFVSAKVDFKLKFFREIRSKGGAVEFRRLSAGQVTAWVRRTAAELGLRMGEGACAYLHQIVGNRLTDLFSELQKLQLRYGKDLVGIQEVKEMAVQSRSYTIFEFVDRLSFKQGPEAITILRRFLEEGGKDETLRVLGMLNRQIGLLFRAKAFEGAGKRSREISRDLGLPHFLATKILQQSKSWSAPELERSLELLCMADDLVKSGAKPDLVLENLVLSLCG